MIGITTVQAVTWPRPTGKGLLPIRVKVTVKGGGREYISMPFATDPRYWDDDKGQFKSTHPEAEKNNKAIALLTKQVNDKVLALSLEEKSVDAKTLKEMVVSKQDSTNFFQFVTEYLKEVAQRVAPGTVKEYERYMSVIEKFHGSRDLSFHQWDRSFLMKYEEYLKSKYSPYSVGTQWTIVMGWIETALKRGVIKQLTCTDYPTPSGDPQEKEYFSMQEIKRLEEIADDKTLIGYQMGQHQEIAAWMVFGCYTGLRISDWETFDYATQVRDGELRLRPKKNKGYVSIELSGAFKRAVDRVKNLQKWPYHTNRARIFSLIEFLKWEKHITPHCMRKTFAVTICSAHGIPLADCAAYMGITVSICEKSYYRITQTELHERSKSKWKSLQ